MTARDTGPPRPPDPSARPPAAAVVPLPRPDGQPPTAPTGAPTVPTPVVAAAPDARPGPVGRLLATADRGGDALRAAVAAWLASLRSPDTRDAYARDLRDWLTWLDRHAVDAWRPRRAHADLYRKHLEGTGLGPGSVRRKMSAVSSFYTYLEDEDEDGVLRNRVRAAAKPPRPDSGKTGALTERQVRALLAAADAWVAETATAGRPRALRAALTAQMLVYLLAAFGIRASEARTLKLDDLDVHAGKRRARFTLKGGKDNYRRIPDALHRVLTDYLAFVDPDGQRTRGPVLITRTGKPLARSEPGRILSRLAARAELQVHPHQLRATFITISLKHRDVEEVRRAVGHASRAQTESYNDRDEELDTDPSVLVTELIT